jgi:hypothetical protein
MKLLIPKHIIQTGKSIDLPLLSKAAVEQFPEYQGVFNSFRFAIQRYDFFRYLAVYQYGGFYLDLDVILDSSLSALLDFRCVFPFEELTMNTFLRREYGMGWEIGSFAFGAAAGTRLSALLLKTA